MTDKFHKKIFFLFQKFLSGFSRSNPLVLYLFSCLAIACPRGYKAVSLWNINTSSLNIDKSLCEWLEKFLTQYVEETPEFESKDREVEVVRITGLSSRLWSFKSDAASIPTDQSDFFLLFGLKRSPVAAPELASFLLLAFLARDLAPPFVLFVLHSGQFHTSGIAVLFTFAQARCTQVPHELHSIMGRPA